MDRVSRLTKRSDAVSYVLHLMQIRKSLIQLDAQLAEAPASTKIFILRVCGYISYCTVIDELRTNKYQSTHHRY